MIIPHWIATPAVLRGRNDELSVFYFLLLFFLLLLPPFLLSDSVLILCSIILLALYFSTKFIGS